MAVTARRAATAGGRASGRCFVSEFLDVLDDLLLALDVLTFFGSLGLRRLGISTGLEGSSVEGMAGVRIQGACDGGRLQGEAASDSGGEVERKLDFVEERLWAGEEDLGGDEEYLKERGTSIVKSQSQSAMLAAAMRMTLILIIKSAERLCALFSRAPAGSKWP